MDNSFTVRHETNLRADTSVPDTHQDPFSKAVLGFWIYLMTDCLLFGTLFATYAVLYSPLSLQIFDLRLVFLETMILLASSLTCGLGLLGVMGKKRNIAFLWLGATFLLGSFFVALELMEFTHLVNEGYSWQKNAFLSAYFTLVGTHGLHVSFGLLWLVVMFGQLFVQGINPNTLRRMTLFSLFWHFLDVIWIFIFTFVYLLGAG